MPYDARVLEKHRETMKRGDDVPVTLVNYEEQKSDGFVRILRLSSAERNKRASKWLIGCLVLAPVTVIAPPHFLWVVVTVTVGIVGSWLRRGRSELVLGGEGKCPKCGAFQILDGGNAEFPMAHFCTECRERSLVAPVAPALPATPATSDKAETSATP